MNNGEFYNSNEYNPIKEYKHFPAEAYTKPEEENQCGPEDTDLGKETTTLQTRTKATKKSDGAKTLIDKIFGSIRGVATMATVSAASLVVTTTLITGAPQAELLSLTCGDTYVEYQIAVSGLEEDGEYAIVLSTSNEEDIENELDGDGTYQSRIEGLKPEWEYTLSLVQFDTVLGEISHFEIKLQTMKYSDQQPMPPPEPEPEPEPIPVPNVQISGVEIVGINEIRIDFTHENIPENGYAELEITCGDLGTVTVTVSETDIERGYVITSIEHEGLLTVTPTVLADGAGEVLARCDSYEQLLEQTLAADVTVGLYDQMITFYPVGITNGAEYISIVSSTAPESAQLMWIEGAVQIWYDTQGEITYTIYFADENGDAVSSEIHITVNTDVVAPAYTYTLDYVNPGNVGITYNSDGTINVYIKTNFTAESDEVYYTVTLGGIKYESRESVARIEHLPDKSYALQYDVCVDIDGIRYSIYHVTPSGMVNEPYMYYGSSLNDNILTLQLYSDETYTDMSSVRLVGSNGEEILLGESDFVYNEEYGTYDITVQFSESVTEVVIYMMANPFHDGLSDIDGCIGETRKLFTETVY